MADLKGLPTKTEVLHTLFNRYQPQRETEMVPLDSAVGRVSAQTLYSLNTVPVVRASMGDGIAVASACFKNGKPDTSRWQAGRDYVRADTGDDFADRYDAVIMIENVTFNQSGGLALKDGLTVEVGTGVRGKGSTIKEDEFLIAAGMPVRPCDLAALAAGGIMEVPVCKKPVVVFIPTGSELIPAGAKPQRGQTIDANSIMAKHTLLEMGAECISYPIVKDNPGELERVLESALEQGDIVIMNGGSSKGEEDFTPRLFERKGEVLFHGIAAAPGRPMCLAVIDGKPVINLPGPVLAAYYGLDWCIRALVHHYLGLPMPRRQTVKAALTQDMSTPQVMDFLCRINLAKGDDGAYRATPVPRASGIGDCMSTNGLFISKIGESQYQEGDVIEVELLRGMEFI